MGPNTECKNWELLGTFSVTDAKWFISRFEEEKMRFRVGADDSAIRKMGAVQAEYGGTFGAGVGGAIYVAHGDMKKARKIFEGWVAKNCRV